MVVFLMRTGCHFHFMKLLESVFVSGLMNSSLLPTAPFEIQYIPMLLNLTARATAGIPLLSSPFTYALINKLTAIAVFHPNMLSIVWLLLKSENNCVPQISQKYPRFITAHSIARSQYYKDSHQMKRIAFGNLCSCVFPSTVWYAILIKLLTQCCRLCW